MNRYRVAVPVLIITGFMLIFTAQAQNAVPFRFSLTPASDHLTACLAVATATVSLFPKDALPEVDTLDLETEGLLPDTTFTVFLTEPAYAPSSVAQYIGDFKTNADGRASMRADAVVGEAFSSALVAGIQVRKEVNHVVLWFSDRSAGNACFASGTGPITALNREKENIYEEAQKRTFNVWPPREYQWQLAN